MGRGKLTFKGESSEARKRKWSKSKFKTESSVNDCNNTLEANEASVSRSSVVAGQTTETSDSGDLSGTSRSATTGPSASAAADESHTAAVRPGTGTITVSGTVVTGHKTRFLKELQVGDAVIVLMNGNQPEMRVVTMRLSDISLNLSSPFSQQVKSQPFQFINKPRNHVQEAHLAKLQSDQHAKDEESKASGVYGATNELVYREKTEHGSYRIKKIKLEGGASRAGDEISRGDLLELRTKKKSDKYC